MTKNALLFIAPLLTLVLCIFVIIERQPYCASWSDPTFCYLFNGLNIAIGYFKVGQVDHPGTPLQIFAAAAIRFFHLFSGDKDVVHDVIARPQWYLFRICIIQSVFISTCMYVAARMMLRFTGNIFYALLIQLTHVISFQALFFSQNLMTEFILVITGILLAPLFVAYTFSDKETGTKKLIIAALICGLMVAGKISSAPVVLLWLFILKSLRHAFIFILLSALSFLIWTIPAWHAASFFVTWLTNITTHTGTYGSGEEGFVIWKDFFDHLKFLLSDNRFFTGTLIVLLILIFERAVSHFKYKQITVFSGFKTLAAVLMVTALELFMVSKHFGAHYVIPVHMLVVPCWIIILKGRFKNFIEYYLKNKQPQVIAVCVVLSCSLLVKQAIQYSFYPKLEQPAIELLRQIGNKKYDVTLFVNTITAPLPQAALYFGVNYSGDCCNMYKQVMRKTYPPFYLLNNENTKLTGWDTEYKPEEVLNSTQTFLLYAPNDKFNIDSVKWSDANLQLDTILFSYINPSSNEELYLFKLKNMQ